MLHSGKRVYRRMSRPPQEMQRVVGALSSAKQLFDYSCYPKFSSLVTLRQDIRPRKRTLAWLMHTIEEVYDQRYIHDTQEFRNRELGDSLSNEDRLSNQFPVFVVDHFSKMYGLRNLVDQNCWDMLYNVHALRKHYLEVEIFARFIEEYYDDKDLLFYLYARNVVQTQLQVNFKQRWSELGRGKERMPPALPMSRREALRISKLVFGPDARDLSQALMQLFDAHCVGQRGSSRRGGVDDTRRVDVMQYLHLSLVQYREAKGGSHRQEVDGGRLEENPNPASAGTPLSPESRIFDGASVAYEERMKQLASAEKTAEEHLESDQQRERRVHEMENAIRRAMGTREGSEESAVPRPEDDAKIAEWAQEMLSREQRAAGSAVPSAERSPARNYAESEAQFAALEKAKALERVVEEKSEALGKTGDGVNTAELQSFLRTIESDRQAIERIERSPQKSPKRSPRPQASSPSSATSGIRLAGAGTGVGALPAFDSGVYYGTI